MTMLGIGRLLPLAAAAALMAWLPACAQPPASSAVDYSQSAAWLCRPGAEQVCATGLDAMVVTADGSRTRQSFAAAPNPPIDCFYVYPTVSAEPSPYADMVAGPEEAEVTRGQAGRLTSRCRLFAPLYRQMTLAGLKHAMAAGQALDWTGPYQDVLAAWRWYLAHDNQGRGVVLVGHSQGAILLQRLIAEEIDGQPAQARLVAAFLAGDPSLPVPPRARVGGAFRHVPLCAAAGETGCVYVWGSYLADDTAADRVFGRNPKTGLVAACVNPAAPAGGSGELKAYLPRPSFAPESDPPWVEVEGQLSAACVADAQGDVLRVTIQPTRFAGLLTTAFHQSPLGAGWGLHHFDMNLPQGNILDLVNLESRSWTRSPAH